MVSSKPIEEHDGPNYNQNNKSLRLKRQLPEEITLNKQFFDNIFQASRKSRDTSDGDDVPTIALHDLISSVEHTLIHSAQNLAAFNVTGNLTSSNTETDSNNNTNVQHTQHIILPITIPKSAPKTEDFVTESIDVTTVSEEDLIRDNRSNDDEIVPEHKVIEFESVKPIENSNLGILFPVSLNPSANISHVIVAENVPEETNNADQSNITIIHTINSTQVIPSQSSESDVVHVHQQQITLFSANAGFFPNIHAVKAEDLPLQASSAQPEDECSGEENSNESDDETSGSEEKSSSSSSSEEKEKTKNNGCIRKSSVATSKAVESTTPSAEAVKKIKTDELKEQIAEVEADPVILTQGI